MSRYALSGRNKLDQAYDYLTSLIEDGSEFPDAHCKACARYELSVKDGERIAGWYDDEVAS